MVLYLQILLVMEAIIETSNKRLRNTSSSFRRYLINDIDWGDRLISIVGSRGAGKTTLMLQHLKENYGAGNDAVYLSLDNTYFTRHSLIDTVITFSNAGGKTLFLDEVHKYPNWSIELKNIYDDFPELKVVFSGSSMLELYKGQGDLSRRLSSYKLPPLSLREFIELEHKISFPVFKLEDILENHVEISNEIGSKIKPVAVFKDYLEYGALPFYKESRGKYHERLVNVINMILDYDLPSITPIHYMHVVKIKMLLKIISDMVPFKPNVTKLASQTQIDRKTVLKYLDLLNRSELISLLNPYSASDSVFTKPTKIYLGNPNLMFSLCDEKPNIGTLRETFFYQQLSVKHKVYHSRESDFLVDNKYTFEIGGRKKGAAQIKGLENAFIAADDMEYGFGNKIPLWMFGFLY